MKVLTRSFLAVSGAAAIALAVGAPASADTQVSTSSPTRGCVEDGAPTAAQVFAGPHEALRITDGQLFVSVVPANGIFVGVESHYTIAWFNVSNGRTGIEPLDGVERPQNSKFSNVLDTGNGRVFAVIYGSGVVSDFSGNQQTCSSGPMFASFTV